LRLFCGAFVVSAKLAGVVEMTVAKGNLRPIIVVLGATAAGKSAVAMEVAQVIEGEILSVDSMQVYRGMDIGTAKPSLKEQRQVRHHLIDMVAPNEVYTVARFVESADAVIAGAHARGVPLIATGGTPMFYKALFQGLFEGPSADDAIRRRLSAEPGDVLHARLALIDPAAAARIHANDMRRLVRALEVFELTGQPISSLQTAWRCEEGRHPAQWFGLAWEKDVLNQRINARVKAMIAAGWLDEVRQLLKDYGELSPTAAEATGYAELVDHLAGRCPLEDAVEQIKIATRQLARRQMKWLRRFADVTWLQPDKAIDAIIRHPD
jgi:tRNA dimethylallyltransferase